MARRAPPPIEGLRSLKVRVFARFTLRFPFCNKIPGRIPQGLNKKAVYSVKIRSQNWPPALQVDNISYNTTLADLRRLFDRYGEIGDIHIPRERYNGQSKGFAFVRCVLLALSCTSFTSHLQLLQQARCGTRDRSPGWTMDRRPGGAGCVREIRTADRRARAGTRCATWGTVSGLVPSLRYFFHEISTISASCIPSTEWGVGECNANF